MLLEALVCSWRQSSRGKTDSAGALGMVSLGPSAPRPSGGSPDWKASQECSECPGICLGNTGSSLLVTSVFSVK